ncbi:UDP-4-amino-4,6-dideoxy-N-acetyl-beta-L-altrosamine transaminase [Propionivibrio sp.]|uniref:UDP-4-amino-4, 6-dideoxy-N-acetyl-beta-L-altrosamine transaminase n=1 Tax=Propionivibrio sp. TaxID=2212460 RepID=UPI003BF09431
MPEPDINYALQDISAADIEAVVEVLRSEYLTQGPTVPAFERAVADYCGAPHAVATNSATSALHIACIALGLGPNDLLWTVPNTFVASANCARYCGADVDFVDIDPQTRNISLQALRDKLDEARHKGRLPKIVVPVAFAGHACPMAEIRTLADEFGFRIIEDAAHAIGGRYRGQPIGNGEWADITIFSFHPVKIITTGEGGMAVTRNSQLAAHMARLRSHGITRELSLMEGEIDGPWHYQMIELGWNYRMTDIQAALGLSQMQRIDEFIAHRTALADRYDGLLADSGLTLPHRDPDCTSAWHLYAIGWNEQRSVLSRAEAYRRLHAAGIIVNVHYIPVHLQPYYRRLGFSPGQFPNAEAYYARALSIPLYATLTPAQQDRVVRELLTLLGQ